MNTKALLHKILAILSVMFFDVASGRIAFPVLTLLFFDQHSHLFAKTASHDVRSYWYGFAIAAPSIVGIFSGPLLSTLSDIWGRKRILLLAILGGSLAAMLSGFAIIFGSLTVFIAGCLLQGFFAKTNPIAQASVAESVDENKKIIAMGYLQTAISLGAFVSPILGGGCAYVFFGEINFAFPFFISLLFYLVALFILLFYFRETFQPQHKKIVTPSFFKTIPALLLDKNVLLISFLLLFSQLSWSMYYQYIAPVLKLQFDFSATQLGLFVGMIAAWLALASSVGIIFLEKFFTLTTITFLSFLSIFVGYIITLAGCFYHINFLAWCGAVPIAFGDVIAYTVITTLYSNAVSKEQQGSVMGVCFLIIAIAWAGTGMIGGYLISISPTMPLTFAPLGTLLALLVIKFTKKNLALIS